MERILGSREIRALIRGAHAGKKRVKPGETARQIAPCNFSHAGRFGPDDVQAVRTLHAAFAGNFASSLGSFLRVPFEAKLASGEQVSFNEAFQRVPQMSYSVPLVLRPFECTAALRLDLSLAFPIIDLLLGGGGKPQDAVRDLTEIEENVLERVMRIACHELESIWQPLLDVSCEPGQRQQQDLAVRAAPSKDTFLSLGFEARLPDVQGRFTLALPAEVVSALLRKLPQESFRQKRPGSSDASARLKTRVQDCRLQVELRLPEARVRIGDLVGLRPGQVLVLPHRVGEPVLLLVAGKKMFNAQPVRSADRRGGQVLQLLHIGNKSRRQLT